MFSALNESTTVIFQEEKKKKRRTKSDTAYSRDHFHNSAWAAFFVSALAGRDEINCNTNTERGEGSGGIRGSGNPYETEF